MSSVPPPETARRPRRRPGVPPSPNGIPDDQPCQAVPSPNGDRADHADPGAPLPNGDSGRDARGRFTPGNPGGPGNPFARRVAVLRRALSDAVTEVDIKLIAQRLVQRAHAGDVASCKLLLGYVLGRPTETIDPDTVDLQEWQRYRDHAARAEDLTGLLATVPPQVACLLARAVLPYVGDAFARTFVEQAGLETLPLPAEGDDGPSL
jgi:hypothetical protein